MHLTKSAAITVLVCRHSRGRPGARTLMVVRLGRFWRNKHKIDNARPHLAFQLRQIQVSKGGPARRGLLSGGPRRVAR